MNIRILQLVEGAKEATGITVVIDVFRAMTVEATLLSMGAEKVIPMGDLEAAYRYKAEHPEVLLVGERHGKMLPGFDFGNSPSEIAKGDIAGKTVVHTTSAGTQGIANAKNAEVILGGCLANARATAEYIQKSGHEDVSLVCMGLEALRPTEEDTLCAEYIRSILEGVPMDTETQIPMLKNTSGAKFFDPAQQEAFPMPDFEACVHADVFPFAMRVEKDEDGLSVMRRIPMGEEK